MIAAQISKRIGITRSIYSSGDKYGHVMLTGKSYMAGDSIRMVECICKCKNIFWTRLSSLKNGSSKSCGCYRDEIAKAFFTTHGLNNHPIYSIWEGMKQRCYNEKCGEYHNYGGIGVGVCDEWINNPKVFVEWAIKNGWQKGLDLDKDILYEKKFGTKPGMLYSPLYCCFVTRRKNCRAKRTNHIINAFGETKCIVDWVNDERCMLESYQQIIYRINKLGFDPEKAISAPKMKRGRKRVNDICPNIK